jgi:hypothetical protein
VLDSAEMLATFCETKIRPLMKSGAGLCLGKEVIEQGAALLCYQKILSETREELL